MGLKQYVAHVLCGQYTSQKVLLSVVSKRVMVVLDMMLCSMVDGYHFGEKIENGGKRSCIVSVLFYISVSLYSLKMEVSGSSKIFVHIYTCPEEEGSRSLLSNKLHGVLSHKNIIFCYFVVTWVA